MEKKESRIRSGWNTFGFVATSRSGKRLQCENLIGHCGSFRPITVNQDALASAVSEVFSFYFSIFQSHRISQRADLFLSNTAALDAVVE